jgi:alpha-ketoglutarate-dependent taurine dioxygenase
MSTIARNPAKMLSKQTGVEAGKKTLKKQSVADGWHSDIAFERVTSDYTTLINRVRPSTGGDTIFASAHEVYERISPPMRAFLETLTGQFSPVGYEPDPEHAHLYQCERGHPRNIDQSLTAEHPIVRTNPVTGWKSIFGVGHHLQRINGLAPDEEDWLKHFLMRLITENHDLQARVKWEVNDLAVWDNRAVYHTATYDYDEPRVCHRVVAVGEPPALDPNSTSRSEALS